MMDSLFGWTSEQWGCVAQWAKVDALPIYDEAHWPRLLDLREKWLLAGGPVSGPSGRVLLSA